MRRVGRGRNRAEMKSERRPGDLARAIQRLPADKPVMRRGVWYATQKEHWLGWLKEYDGPGAYGRSGRRRSAEFVYYHIVEAAMLSWLIKAAGVERSLVAKATAAAAKEDNLMSKSRAIRTRVPWSVVERSLWPRDGAAERRPAMKSTGKTPRVRLAISVRQPWADQIMRGIKKKEFRSVPTRLNERVYAYASKTLAGEPRDWRRLGRAPEEVTRERIIATVEIIGCRWDRTRQCFAYALKEPKELRRPRRARNQPGPLFWRPQF